MTQWHRIGMALTLTQVMAITFAPLAPAQLTAEPAQLTAEPAQLTVGPTAQLDGDVVRRSGEEFAHSPQHDGVHGETLTPRPTADPVSFVRLSELVDSLGHDSFHRRRASAETLWGMSQSDSNSRDAVVRALWRGSLHQTMEVRISSARLLESITLSLFDRQVESLLNPRVEPSGIGLIGWKAFSEMAGTDFAARSLYARMALRHGPAVEWIESGIPESRSIEIPDPYRVDGNDALTWALVIAATAASGADDRSQLNGQVRMSLSHSGLGPRLVDRDDSAVLRRLIGHWVTASRRDGLSRDRLLIAMRYACHEQAREICDDLFQRPNVPPSCLATALLCASVLQRPTIEADLRRHLDDERTAHVWQLIASRRTRIRTQVSDVALALLLREHGIDPRTVGFQELQADPILVYRDHSLGFADEEARQQAYRHAWREIGGDRPD